MLYLKLTLLTNSEAEICFTSDDFRGPATKIIEGVELFIEDTRSIIVKGRQKNLRESVTEEIYGVMPSSLLR